MAAESAVASTSATPLHRIRFVDYEPSPITALSFAPLPLPSPDPKAAASQAEKNWKRTEPEFGCLIVGRQNGQVDLWEYVEGGEEGLHGGWVLSKVLPATLSHPTISLLALVIRDPSVFYDVKVSRRVPRLEELRLFTAGSDSGDLVERCLATGRILQVYSVPSAPIWSLSVSPTHDQIVLASASVNLHFLTLSPVDPLLEPSSPVHRSEPLPGRTRTLSIAWGPPTRAQLQGSSDEETKWTWKNQYIVTGNSDSSLRKWSTQTGRILGKMAVNKSRKEKKKGPARSTIVWSVGVLSDHTVISGDSMGAVTFWDGGSLAQIKSFQSHAADAQCMAIGPGGRSVYTSGPDQKIAQFTLVGASDNQSHGKSSGKWVRTAFKRIHVHDVRALAVYPPFVPAPNTSSVPVNLAYAPVLASGGVDMQVILSPASTPDLLSGGERKNPIARNVVTNFSDSLPRRLQMLPAGRGTDVISVSRRSRLVLCRRYRGVGIWRVRSPDALDDDQAGWVKVLEMDFQLRTSLTAAALSEDGKWLAVADAFETKLYKLRADPDTEDGLIPKRVKSFSEDLVDECTSAPLQERGTGASSLAFTPDSNRLIIGFALSAALVAVELGKEARPHLRVLRVFLADALESGRGVMTLSQRSAVQANGDKGRSMPNGHVNGVLPMEMDESESGSAVGSPETDDEKSDGEEDVVNVAVATSLTRVNMLAVSEDGQWLASCDNRGHVNVYNLDVLKLHCTVPTFKQAPVAMTFASDRALVLALPVINRLEAFDVESRRLCREVLPGMHHFEKQSDSILGISYHASSNKILAWGQGWLGAVEVKQSAQPRRGETRTKRKRNQQIQQDNAAGEGFARVVQGYRQLTALAPIGKEILVVERPFTDLRNLPPAFTTAKYGT